MFKPNYGTCSGPCGNDGKLVVVKDGFCQRCNHERKQAKKKVSGKTKSKPIKRATGEGSLMEEIVLNLPDHETRCFVCDKRIAVLTYSNMAHVLSKGRFPLFRLNPNNIRILCFNIQGTGCHSRYDHQPKSTLIEPGWQKLFDLAEELKIEYKKLEKK